MTNKQKLTEQQRLQTELLELMEIGDFSKAIARKVGQGVGAVKGAGQKVVGATKRGAGAIGQAFSQGKTDANKAVAGQDYKAPQPKAQAQAQPQAQAQQTKQPGGISTALKKFGQGVAGADSYKYRLGTQAQQDAQANAKKQTPAQPGTQVTTATTPAAGGTQAQKRTKTGGKVAGQLSQTKSAQSQRDRRATNKVGGSAVSTGISQAQKDAANKGVANLKKQAGQTATKVPGQKAPVAQVDANKDGKDDKTGKPISKTAQNVGAKTGVQTAKIAGQKVDLNDPKMANMRAAIDKALGKGTTASIDKLDPPGKDKLKKALA